MFPALLNNGITLLAALLGNLKKSKHLRTIMLIVLFFCIVTLVLTVITGNLFPDTKKAPQPMIYIVPIYPLIIKPEDIEENLKKFNDRLKEINPEKTKENPINDFLVNGSKGV